MGTILVTALIDKTARLLVDNDNIRWSRDELTEYLNEAQRQITVGSPADNATTEVLRLAEGSKQSLPAGAISLLDVGRNMGRSGDQPSRAARVVSRRLLDSFDPYWHYSNPGPLVHNVVFDEQDQTSFWVSPPSDGNATLEVRYLKTPDPIAEGESITVQDAYEAAIVEYMMYRACSKEAPFSPGPDRANAHLSMFQALVMSKGNGEAANTPNRNLTPQSPGAAPGGQS